MREFLVTPTPNSDPTIVTCNSYKFLIAGDFPFAYLPDHKVSDLIKDEQIQRVLWHPFFD